MTTLIDDGLPESALGDPVTLVDFDQLTVVDVDNIDATIEDPGYILNEACNRNEEYTSSYKKRSLTLPVSFFDISSNISLLQRCRPISIKIVDCNIYPWYYKEMGHTVKNKIISNQDHISNQCKLTCDSTNLKSSTFYDTCKDDSFYTIASASFSTVNLSLEQQSVVIQLEEDIDNEAYISEIKKGSNEDIDNGNATVKHDDDPSVLNKNSPERNDLVTFESIAQTIVCNIDVKEENTKSDTEALCVLNSDSNGIYKKEVVRNVKTLDSHIREKEGRESVITTSPILPYTIKPQKKIKSKPRILRKSPKEHSVLERCNNYNKTCDKDMSPINQIIPHYHYRASVYENNNNNLNYTSMVDNQMLYQQPVTKDPSSHWSHPSNKVGSLSSNGDKITAHNFHKRLVQSPGSYEELSYLNFNKDFRNNPFINSSEVTNQHFIENMNPNVHTTIPERQFHSLRYENNDYTMSDFPLQSKVKNGNSLRVVRRTNFKQVSQENNRGSSKPLAFSKNVTDSFVPNSMYLLNEYVDYSTTQIPLQRTVSNMPNVIQNNPILSELLNIKNLSEYYQPTLEQYDGLGHRAFGCPQTKIAQQNCSSSSSPSPALSSNEYLLPSTQFTKDNNCHYENTGMHLHSFSNSEDVNLFQRKINSNLKHSYINPREMTKEKMTNNNVKYISVEAPKGAISVPCRMDSMKQNIYTNTGIQSITIDPCGIIDPKMSINTNTKISNQSFVNVPVKSAVANTIDIRMFNKNNMNTMTHDWSSKESDYLTANAHRKIQNQKNGLLFQRNVFNPIIHGTPASYQLHSIPKINKVSKVYNTTVQPTKDVNNSAYGKFESQRNGYSAPILPIPSFKKSLEMLLESQHSQVLNSTVNDYLETEIQKHMCDTSKENRKNQDFENMTRKRKLSNDEKMYINSKKISLQEYKIRSENVITIS